MRFVAIGDSFTEGVGDDLPDGTVRGWADLVAVGIATSTGEPIQYANLAIRGRLLGPIVTDQLEQALALSPAPTMITLNGGGNDMLRPGMDADRLAAMSEVAVRRCLDAGVRPVLLSGPDPTDRLPFGRVVRKRGDALTVAIEQLRDRYSLTLINIFHDTSMHHPGYWSPDRLHLNPAGHARVAMLVLTGLGYDASAIAQVPPTTYSTGPRAEAQFYWQHVRPWLHRRVKRQSSGDGRSSKHHSWATVPPQPVQ